MSGQVSPFAALTGAEKQIKWLEYQTVRLPYVEAVAPQPPLEEKPPARPAVATPPPEITMAGSLKPSPASDFQKTRHSQYNAVIARMKQAERMASAYRTMSDRK